MKSRLQDNNREMYSTQNEGKSVVAEVFIRILKNKIYQYMTLISKNVYIAPLTIAPLGDIANKYNNTHIERLK